MITTFTMRHLIASTILLLLLPAIASADTVIRSGDKVLVGQDQLIEGDLYSAGNIVSVSGQIEGDFLVAGTEVNLNGQVGADMLVLGANVDINGTIGDDLRIVGSNVVVAEPVLGDLFIVGANVKLLSTASVAGDVTLVGGSVIVEAPIEGDVLGWVESLRIDSAVAGAVEVTTGNLTLGDNAVIGGTIEYVSETALTRSQSATVEGEVFRSDPVVPQNEVSPLAVIVPLLGLLFSAALWFLVSKRLLVRVVHRALEPGVRAVLLGAGVLLLAPFAIMILVASMLGLLPGFALLALYILLVLLAIIAMPVVAAQFVISVVKDATSPITLLTLLIGVGLVGVMSLVPFIGPILLLGFFILTYGALIDLVLRANR